MPDHIVRTGILGGIGRFTATTTPPYGRGVRVICRTNRGLEIGTVLNVAQDLAPSLPHSGTILRKATTEDHLLWARIEKHRDSAFRECQRLLKSRNSSAALMDAELLFDGSTIFFYFFGDVSDVEGLTSELAETYEAKIQLREFAKAVDEGCGPSCGTEDSGGCHEGGCSTCTVAVACGLSRANR